MILLADLFYRNHHHYISRIFYSFAELNFTQLIIYINANRTYSSEVEM